jgi:hypothetical protein
MKQLQEEVALESVTNIEFEESSRRSFEFLAGQIKTLKSAFNTLTDTFLQELENMSSTVSGEFWRLEEGLLKDVGAHLRRSEALEKRVDELERLNKSADQQSLQLQQQSLQLQKRVNLITGEMESVLQVIPRLEESMLKNNQYVQERLELLIQEEPKTALSIHNLEEASNRMDQRMEETSNRLEDTSNRLEEASNRMGLSIQNLEEKLNRVDENLREEFEQKHLKFQRNVTRQLEGMNRVLVCEEKRSNKAGNLGTGPGGGSFGNLDHVYSPHRDRGPSRDYDRDREWNRDRAWSDKSDRSPLRIPTENRRSSSDWPSDIERRGSGLETYRERIGSMHDSPRSTDNGKSSFGKRGHEVSSAKPGHIKMELDLSGLQSTAQA